MSDEPKDFIVTVRFKSPDGRATEEDARKFVDDALKSVFYGYSEENPFYGFDDETVQVLTARSIGAQDGHGGGER